MARAMKDSGIAWIGEIPEGWNVLRLKSLFSFGKGLPITKENLEETGVPVISYGQIHSKTNTGVKLQDDLFRFVSPSYIERNAESLVHSGDIIVADTSEDTDGCGNCVHVDREMQLFAGYHTIILQALEQDDNKYLAYQMKTDPWRSQIRSRVSGVKVFSISRKILSDSLVIFPPLSEQSRIAAYLDNHCAEIDQIMEQTRVTIEEYKKLKQSIITEAVTRGVRSPRKMKDSGVEWIGEIPVEWEVCKVRHIGKTQNGISKSGDFFGEGYPFVSYGDVYRNMILPHHVEGLVLSTEEEQKLYSVQKGDIFFTRTSETIEEVGFSSVCEETIPNATFAGFLIRVRPFNDKLDIGYSKYYFRSGHHRFYLVKQMNLVTRASLGQTLLKGMHVLVPPKAEQIEIADYLDYHCTEIDRLIDSKQQLLTELEAYKKSVIYEYITGKREVPQ